MTLEKINLYLHVLIAVGNTFSQPLKGRRAAIKNIFFDRLFREHL